MSVRAPTGGSIVLLTPYATQISAYRTTFASVPTATVAPGSGLTLGSGSVNTSPITVRTADGPLVAPAETAAIFPTTNGSASPATVTFSGISYHLGSLVAPGALVGTAAVDSGANGGGSNLAGNDYVNALNTTGLGGGGGAAAYQPDGRIKRSTASALTGDDVYNTTGSGQTLTGKIKPGRSVTFLVDVQNDGTSSDGFTLAGSGNQSGFTVRYLQGESGSTDITSQVEGGTYDTLNVAPGDSAPVQLVIKAKKSVAAGTSKTWALTATSEGDPGKQDVVKAKVKAT